MDETTAVQDYLKAVYQLGGHEQHVSTSALAQRLGVTRASVSGMVKRLHDAGLLSHRRYKGAKLTAKGRRQALEVIRHHRLLETYLTEVVGMPLDKVHAEADALEHHISEELESRLAELLGNPSTDPHGHPIPSATLVMEERHYPSLDEAEAGTRWVVERVHDHDPELLVHLDGLGLRPGSRVHVDEIVPFGGGLRARVDGIERLIGSQAAAAVAVSKGDR